MKISTQTKLKLVEIITNAIAIVAVAFSEIKVTVGYSSIAVGINYLPFLFALILFAISIFFVMINKAKLASYASISATSYYMALSMLLYGLYQSVNSVTMSYNPSFTLVAKESVWINWFVLFIPFASSMVLVCCVYTEIEKEAKKLDKKEKIEDKENVNNEKNRKRKNKSSINRAQL